jgi:hypothetical protein
VSHPVLFRIWVQQKKFRSHNTTVLLGWQSVYKILEKVIIEFWRISNEKAGENRLLVQSYAFPLIPTVFTVPGTPNLQLFCKNLLGLIKDTELEQYCSFFSQGDCGTFCQTFCCRRRTSRCLTVTGFHSICEHGDLYSNIHNLRSLSCTSAQTRPLCKNIEH